MGPPLRDWLGRCRATSLRGGWENGQLAGGLCQTFWGRGDVHEITCPHTSTIKFGVDVSINVIVALSGALAAIAALVVAAVTCLQLKHSRFALGVDLILKLEASFDSPDMKTARSLAAKALKDGGNTADVEPVLDFFETVGVLLRRRAIDQELAWDSFSYWVLRYAVLAREQIQFRRKDESDETYYQEFEFLVKRLTQTEIDRRRLKSPPFFPTELLASFLEEEIDY